MSALDRMGYCCKYAPLELMRAHGVEPELLDGERDDFERAESLTHANLCTHAKALIEQAIERPAVLLTDCCDSLRRAHDVLACQDGDADTGADAEASVRPCESATRNADAGMNANADALGHAACRPFVHLMGLPHEADGCSVSQLANQLTQLAGALARETGRAFDRVAFLDAWRASSDAQPALSQLQQPFVAVLGARVGPQLEQTIQDGLDLPVINLTCSGQRRLEAPPANAEALATDALMERYAAALLAQTPCMRMSDVRARRALTEHPQLAAIVYNTVKFCDFYAFDLLELKARVDVPLLKIETDYAPAPAGQLSTRLEALGESLDPAARKAAVKAMQDDRINDEGDRRFWAGIDSGSTSTNMVVLNEAGQVAASTVVRTGPKAALGAQAAFDDVCRQLGARPEDFAAVMATGYGRANIPFATGTLTEITCHARGAHHVDPACRTIVDIGGQDSKVICLDEDGAVTDFIMNDKCAAGTGRFLEAMARTLEIDLERLSEAGLSWEHDLSISSMCTVFAESEVISLIADNRSEQDIVHGLNKSIASRTASMVARSKGSGPFMMTGGVARNRGVVEELERKLSAPLAVAPDPDLCGALGAALFAWEDGVGA